MREYVRILEKMSIHAFWRDPRHFQIFTLSSLLLLIIAYSDFAPSLGVFALTAFSTLVLQAVFTKLVGAKYDIRSPLITALSLTLLLKAAAIWVFPLAALLAMASKFALRFNNKHLFNPANFGIVACLVMLPDMVWISPGQWGSALWLGFALICLAVLVLSKARRADMAIFFLTFWALLIFGRALWLGDPLSIPILSMQSGALLIFAFFMISDPMTTPNHRGGRFVFAGVAAFIGYILSYEFQVREGIFYALFLTCLLSPFIDSVLKFNRYHWGKA